MQYLHEVLVNEGNQWREERRKMKILRRQLARAEEKILELEWRVEEATECRCRHEERNRVNPVDVGTVEGSNFGDDEYFSPPRTFGVEEPSEEWVMVEEE